MTSSTMPKSGKGRKKLISSGTHNDLECWESAYGAPMLLGSKVKVEPSSKLYEAEYDKETVYTINSLYFDAGGVNIGIGENTDICDMDGYYIKDLFPVQTLIK